jgi:hypothetical protein
VASVGGQRETTNSKTNRSERYQIAAMGSTKGRNILRGCHLPIHPLPANLTRRHSEPLGPQRKDARMTQRLPASTRGWIVTVAAVGINLILGALYAWGVIGKALVVQWHWTKTEAALPFTVSTASFALMMIFAGRWQDKMGPRLVAMVGGVMFGVALCASAYAGTPDRKSVV